MLQNGLEEPPRYMQKRRPHTNQANTRQRRTANVMQSGQFTIERTSNLEIRENQGAAEGSVQVLSFGNVWSNKQSAEQESRTMSPSTATFLSRTSFKKEDVLKQEGLTDKDLMLIIVPKTSNHILETKIDRSSSHLMNQLSGDSSTKTKFSTAKTQPI